MPASELAGCAALSELELWRDMVRQTPGGVVLEDDGLLLLSGPSRHLRVAMRSDQRGSASALLSRVEEFFHGRGPGHTIVAREPRDDDLASAATEAGYVPEWREYAMGLADRPEPGVLPAGVEIALVRSASDVQAFAGVAAVANDDAERERAGIVFQRPQSIVAPHIAAFVASDSEGAVSCAMTLVSHGVAGVFWVATIERARRQGLGDALTRHAARAGFAMGAGAAWLGASQMGAALYERIGFKRLGSTYVEYESPA